VIGDSAYGTAGFRDGLSQRNMTATIKPPPLRAAVPGGFTLDDFTIDLASGTATCPENITVTITKARRASFVAHCGDCPVRQRCTTAAHGRIITLHPHHDLLVAARRQAATAAFDTSYRQHRPMIERTIAWLVRGPNRRLRYRGVDRNRLWLGHRAAAVNLTRLLNLGLTHGPHGWAIT
jgi:Transposase DDE domain